MTNSADPDQLASSEANWSGSTLFAKTELVMFSKRRVNLQRLELLVYRTNFHGPKDVLAIEVLLDLYFVGWGGGGGGGGGLGGKGGKRGSESFLGENDQRYIF